MNKWCFMVVTSMIVLLPLSMHAFTLKLKNKTPDMLNVHVSFQLSMTYGYREYTFQPYEGQLIEVTGACLHGIKINGKNPRNGYYLIGCNQSAASWKFRDEIEKDGSGYELREKRWS